METALSADAPRPPRVRAVFRRFLVLRFCYIGNIQRYKMRIMSNMIPVVVCFFPCTEVLFFQRIRPAGPAKKQYIVPLSDKQMNKYI